jgi:hypothetical protein
MTEYTPFKCPDCGVWWRTATHKCEPKSYLAPPTTTTTVSEQDKKKKDLPKSKSRCNVCGEPLGIYEIETCWEHKKYRKYSHHYKKGYDKYGNPDEESNWKS